MDEENKNLGNNVNNNTNNPSQTPNTGGAGKIAEKLNKEDMPKSQEEQEQQAKENIKKVGEEVEGTVDATVNIAKGVADGISGNWGGLAQDIVNVVKTKQGRRMLFFSFLSQTWYFFVIPIIVIVAIILIVLFILTAYVGVGNIATEFAQKIEDGVVEFFTVDWENDGVIKISDEQIDSLISAIEAKGISIEGLGLLGEADYTNTDVQAQNQERARKYIREFYEAQAMTQTINTNPDWLSKAIDEKIQGEVYRNYICT